MAISDRATVYVTYQVPGGSGKVGGGAGSYEDAGRSTSDEWYLKPEGASLDEVEEALRLAGFKRVGGDRPAD